MEKDQSDIALENMITETEQTLAQVEELSARIRELRGAACGQHIESIQELAQHEAFPAELREQLDAEAGKVQQELREEAERLLAEQSAAGAPPKSPGRQRPGMTRI